MSSLPDPDTRVARYFDQHAADFDAIYEREQQPLLRRLRDQLTRGTVVHRLDFVVERARAWQPATALDVGCGGGRFAIELAKLGVEVTGLDFAPDMVSLAERNAGSAGVQERCTFHAEDLLRWDTSDRFELTLGIGLFDYLARPDDMLARIAEVTAGHVIVSFPRLWHPLVPLRNLRLRLSGCPVWFFRRREVELLASRHLSNYEVMPFHRDFLLVGETG